jgi:hypothetical protein
VTFQFAPWAIDGARTSAALARLATYASSDRSGIVRPTDLAVSALPVAGQGLEIAPGGALVLNGYLSDPDETYVVSNPSTHTVNAASMPSAQPGTSYYLVCVVVGDPEFNQTGHPFMPSEPLDPAVAPDFEYVRVVIVPCSAGTTDFDDLGFNYPGYALARLEIPGSTTTVTNAMITDLRSLSRPRESSKLLLAQPQAPGTETQYTSAAWTAVGGWTPTIEIPRWATHLDAIGRIDGISHIDPLVVGGSRLTVGALAGNEVLFELPDTSGGGERISLAGAWSSDVSALAGTSVQVKMEVSRSSGTGFLVSYYDTIVSIDLRFSEKPI